MYVCAYDIIRDGMHVRHISLSCITYLVLRGYVRPHLEKERYYLGVALSGCTVQCRIIILQ